MKTITSLVAKENSLRLMNRPMPFHGGLGIAKDLLLECWFRVMRIRGIAEGPSEV